MIAFLGHGRRDAVTAATSRDVAWGGKRTVKAAFEGIGSRLRRQTGRRCHDRHVRVRARRRTLDRGGGREFSSVAVENLVKKSP